MAEAVFVEGGEQKGHVQVSCGSVRTQTHFKKSKYILHREEY